MLGDERGARGDAGRACAPPRRAPGADRARDADEAHPDPDLPLRRHPRSGACASPRCSSDDESDRRWARTRRRSTEVAAELRAGERFLLTTHEGPGRRRARLAARHAPDLLTQLGKDSVMFLAAKEFPLPVEYRFLPLEEVFHEPPADLADRDRGLPRLRQHRPHAGRLPAARRRRVLNIDHHHDNTRFGTSTWSTSTPPARPRSSSSSRGCSAPRSRPRSPRRSTSALVTDTGKFMYENTDARTHRDGRRADRGRRRRRRHLPPPLRARADREAAPASPARSSGSSATATRRSSSPTSPPTTTRRPGPARR